MLVLTRKTDEEIVIGDDVVITVVDIRGDKVRLGVRCPLDVPVHRQEVYDAIHGTDKASSDTAPPATVVVQKPADTAK